MNLDGQAPGGLTSNDVEGLKFVHFGPFVSVCVCVCVCVFVCVYVYIHIQVRTSVGV